LISPRETEKIRWLDAKASCENRRELMDAWMVALKRSCSPNDGLKTFDAPDGTAAGGLIEIVPCAAARVAAHDRLSRLNERLYIANEWMYN
jgi:hypothetical protein